MKHLQIKNNFFRHITILLIIACFSITGHSSNFNTDSLLQYLKINGTEDTRKYLKNKDQAFSDDLAKIQAEYLLAYLNSGPDHDKVSDSLANLPILKKISSNELKELLKFTHLALNYLIHQKDTYITTTLTGYKITLAINQKREAYNFLSSLITYYRLFKDPEKIQSILSKMKDLVGNDKYLQARYHIMQGYVYMTDQDDRCGEEFQKGISKMEPFLGKFNDYLTSDRYSLISDSVNVASAYLEYSRWAQGKGDLKKSGELLIMGKKMIPADTTYIIHQINYFNSLSSIYADLGNPQKAMEYALMAVEIAERKNYDKLRNSSVALFLAKALVSEGRYDEALKEYQKAIITAKPGSKMLRNTHLNIARVYHKMGNFERMNYYLNQGDTMKVIGADLNILSPLLNGYRAIYNKNYKEAVTIGNRVLEMAKEKNDERFNTEALLMVSKAYEGAGNYANSLAYYKQYTLSIDSLYNQGQEMALFDLTSKYENEKKEAQIATLSETNALKNSEIRVQRLLLIGLLIGAIALGVFIYLLRSFNKKLSARNVTIEKSVEEKNILLREIHHRVKNNLQVISSLLKLQSAYIKDANAVQAITEGRSRVQAMAILHQNLYGDSSLTGVNIETYFENLIQGLFDTYNINEDKIKLVKNITPIMLDVDTVIPLGLISNELISNALKHAFNESLSGKIDVSLKEVDGVLVLKISDDGIGYISGNENPGFGSKLIQTLSDKMNASLDITNDHGCTVTIRIKEYQKVG